MASVALAYPTVVAQGMTILKPGVQPGDVIFAAPDGIVYAVNTQGQVMKKWVSPVPGFELGYTRPLPNGNLLGRLQKRDPDGTLAETGGAEIFEMTRRDALSGDIPTANECCTTIRNAYSTAQLS